MTAHKLSIFIVAIYSTYGSSGCAGGWPKEAYNYVRNIGGITFDDLYPYNIPAPTCDMDKNDFAVKVVDHFEVLGGEQKMVDYVLGGGTLSVLVDATNWKDYKSGVFSQKKDQYIFDHAVQIVGVNIPGGYWIIRNSWGTWWGENGYVKLALVCAQPLPS